MKGWIRRLALSLGFLLMAGCGSAGAAGEIDIDLDSFSDTVMFAEVTNLLTEPEEAVGKTIRVSGELTFGEGGGQLFCLVTDPTGCCEENIEFEPEQEDVLEEREIMEGDEITVRGVFDTYLSGKNVRCILREAVLE